MNRFFIREHYSGMWERLGLRERGEAEASNDRFFIREHYSGMWERLGLRDGSEAEASNG